MPLTSMEPEYHQRREQLMGRLGKSAAIFRSAPTAVMHNDVEYVFRQDSDFFYLTGFNEPDAVAVLAPHHDEHRFVLFVRPRDRQQEIWSGYRVGMAGAQEEFGADAAYSIAELDEKLPQYLEKADRIYYRVGRDREFNNRILNHWQRLILTYPKRGTGPLAIEDPGPILHAMRQVKSPGELALLRRAIAISAEAHSQARALARPGCYEYEIQAVLEQVFRQQGALGPAYPSIVASGPNSCILHYMENTRQLQEQDLLLIDAGCSYHYYNADITRTFPVSGHYTPEQRELYGIVLEAQKRAIAQVKPGSTFKQVHETAVRAITEGLINLGLLQGDLETLITEEKYKPFFMHGTGHWLGLDVHDVGNYKQGDVDYRLQPGNVLTVEPGIYINPNIETPDDQPEVGACWRGLGIRIEDDVLVTATGCEVLTAAVPKDISASS